MLYERYGAGASSLTIDIIKLDKKEIKNGITL